MYKHDIGIEDWEDTQAVVGRKKLEITKAIAVQFEDQTQSEIPYLLDESEET